MPDDVVSQFQQWYPESPNLYEPRLKGAADNIRPYIFMILNEANKRGFDFRLRETRRSPQQQQQLYAQGRTAPGKIVTSTLNSPHQKGNAFDLVRFKNDQPIWDKPAYMVLRDIIKDLNIPLQQGIITKNKHGNLKWKDFGHIQFPSSKGLYGGVKNWENIVFKKKTSHYAQR